MSGRDHDRATMDEENNYSNQKPQWLSKSKMVRKKKNPKESETLISILACVVMNQFFSLDNVVGLWSGDHCSNSPLFAGPLFQNLNCLNNIPLDQKPICPTACYPNKCTPSSFSSVVAVETSPCEMGRPFTTSKCG